MPLPVESSDTQLTCINEAAREERVKLQVYTVGDRSRLSQEWEDPLQRSKYHVNQDFGFQTTQSLQRERRSGSQWT